MTRIKQLPIFLPDATRGVIKSLDTIDFKNAGIEGVVVNTHHLINTPGLDLLETFGGVKKMMNFDGLVASDSGGFQILSLIYQNAKLGKVTDNGAFFKGQLLTPEVSIQAQFTIGSDIMICLDDVSALSATRDEVKINVQRTIEWAKRCKQEYLKQLVQRQIKDKDRPLLMAVIQGGDFPDLREQCAKALLKLDFDLYGYGGFPIDQNGNFRTEMLDFTAKLMPDDKPKFALGVGTPQNIVDCFKMGYNIFDCVLPTRDARHQRIYSFSKDPSKLDVLNELVFTHQTLDKSESSPISPWCDCLTCQNYSQGYLKHLFKINEFTAGRLLAIHNLRTYSKLIELLRNFK